MFTASSQKYDRAHQCFILQTLIGTTKKTTTFLPILLVIKMTILKILFVVFLYKDCTAFFCMNTYYL